MTPIEIGVLGVGVLFALLFAGLPVGLSMALVGFGGFAWISSLDSALGILRIVPYSSFTSYSLTVIPLFILMGNFAFHSGLSAELYGAARSWFGRLRGGLAMSAVAASAGFAACSGSSVATAATMGKISLPEMKKFGYDDRLATGTLAAGGTMGVLIPPSVILIIYGVLTENSIGKLFLAGFIPGILEGVFYCVAIYLLCRFRPNYGPPGPRTAFVDKLKSMRGAWAVLVIFLLVIGGIYFGIFSPVEAAGIGAFGTFIIGIVRRKLTWSGFKESLQDSLKTSGMIFLIMLGANIFGYFLAVSGLPQALADTMLGWQVNRYVILLLVIVIYIVLGCVMDSMAMILITIPIFYPLVMQLGFNAIWFGIIVVRVCEIGLITPPVGMNLYVIKGIAKDVPMSKIFRGVGPFIVADVLHVAMLVAFPIVVMLIPNLSQ